MSPDAAKSAKSKLKQLVAGQVERLFSTAAIVLTVRRNRLSDKLLEMLILLKIHLKLASELISND